ncbi:MAG TPA: TRAM domain-containing protein [Nitrososphaeraceae archaeon]|nr:TRAM domain-containing protein [Nitrososphaeraceae archaeon]
MFGPKPVESGKEYDVQVTEISRKGDGIARIQGFVIFVKDGKVGQNAKIRVTQVGNRFATAEIVDGSSATEASSQPSEQQSSSSESSEASPESNE